MELPDYKLFEEFVSDKGRSFILNDLGYFKRLTYMVRDIADYFKFIFEKTDPSLGFAVSYYGTEGMAFNLACREHGIKSVDIQHGFQGDYHVAYGRWDKVPKDGYELLPSLFWCWSNSEAQSIKKWCNSISACHKPLVGGNLLLNSWRKKDYSPARSFDDKILKIKKLCPDKCHILYTLSGFTLTERDRLASIIEKLKHSHFPFFIWIRLHPTTLNKRNEIKKLFSGPHIEIDNATDYPLYALLRHMDIHITEFSSTVIEAESFNVPSIITHVLGAETFQDQIKSGHAFFAETTEQIIHSVQILKDKSFSNKNMEMELNTDSAVNALMDLIINSECLKRHIARSRKRELL